ncbi:MAG: DUF732 domain-containing protein [Acidimicrobiales bacterium]
MIRPVRSRRPVAPMVLAAVVAGCALLAGCGRHVATNDQSQKAFLDSVYSQAPGIGSYRTGLQLVSLGQAICGDLESGASVQELGDRLPLVEGNVTLPPGDLGVVISAAVDVMCPKFRKLLGA